GVAGRDHERPDLTGPRRGDLVDQDAARQLAEQLGIVADAAAVPPVLIAAESLDDAYHVDERVGEDHAAPAVEVPGDEVQHLECPRGERAVAAADHAPEGASAVGGGELARQAPYGVGVDAGARGRDLGGVRRDGGSQPRYVVHVAGEDGVGGETLV